jgi:hypothetical protein
MQKLVEKFCKAPTLENARKLAAYAVKHPMAECMLSLEQHAAVVQAKGIAGA